MRDLLDKIQSQKNLTPTEIDQVFAAMLSGQLPDADVAQVLLAWKNKGEGVGEILAGAKALRRHAAKVALPASVRPLIDNCGTGGDGSGSFNLSTAAAVVAATAGARVAKHGNRSVSSKCGSADLLFRAGFPDTLSPAAAGRLLEKTGFTFFFAPNYHPVMKAVAPARKALGVRTIFNLLGPLANPIAPEMQLIGVGARIYLESVAEVLALLGVERALVVHSQDGMDEISPAAPTDGVLVESGKTSKLVIDPKALGVRGTAQDLAGGDADENFKILNDVLAGKRPNTADAVAINAGAVLWLAGKANDLAGGLALARQALASGASRRFFDAWLKEAKALGATP